MTVVKQKPTTPGRRGMVKVISPELYQGRPYQNLVESQSRTSGRNNNGRITVRHRGGGHKRSYRIIDFKRNKDGIPGRIERLEYDPNRSAHIALVLYADGERRYIIAPRGVSEGDSIESGDSAGIRVGNALSLRKIPVGTVVHCIEMKPGKGGQIARAAGSYVQLVGKDQGYALLKMCSGEQRIVRSDCMATIGAVSNPDHQNQNSGKAGRSRWLGKRPHVRGVAMNPVDHPHGGGEGRTSGGRHPVSPWGKPTKGKRTRNNKKTDRFILRRRRP